MLGSGTAERRAGDGSMIGLWYFVGHASSFVCPASVKTISNSHMTITTI